VQLLRYSLTSNSKNFRNFAMCETLNMAQKKNFSRIWVDFPQNTLQSDLRKTPVTVSVQRVQRLSVQVFKIQLILGFPPTKMIQAMVYRNPG